MIADLKPYPEYKDSGLPWLGAMPSHWQLQRMKFLFAECVQKGFPDEPLLAATQTKGVIRKDVYGARTVTAQKDFHLLKLVESGDFVISLRSFEGGIEVAHCRGIISPAYTILSPRPEKRRSYFTHFFKSPDFIRSLTLLVTGIREGQNIDYERLSRAYLPLPPTEDQELIGRFLDYANRRLERTIRAKRKVIALLNEQKQAITHRAVTRGLDPNVSLKPSGISWLGDIPAHWEVRRLRTLVHRIDQGVSPLAEGFLAEGASWGVLKAGCVNRGVFRETEHKKLAENFEIDPSIVVKVGDVLVSRACGSPQLVGSVGKVETLKYQLILSDKTFRPVFKAFVEVDFAVFAMNSRYYRDQVEQAISGAEGLANNLPLSSLRDFQLAIPPRQEAQEIAAYLLESLRKFDNIITRTEREIALLREYRTRLIADVVTGKLDVREAARHLPIEADEPETLIEADQLEEGEESFGGDVEMIAGDAEDDRE
jgi:type I restriction enzyme S subunit